MSAEESVRSKLDTKKFRHLGTLFLILVLIALSSSVLVAQRITGDILGRVTDESGGVTPGVQIDVLNKESGATRIAVTDDTGNYHISLLPVGNYTVTATLAGFKMETVSNLILKVDDRARVDFVLKVGNISEQVEVTAIPGLVKTDSADVGIVVEKDKLVNLP